MATAIGQARVRRRAVASSTPTLAAVALASGLSLWSGVSPAQACSCAPAPSPCAAVARGAVVFLGTVLSVAPFEKTRSWVAISGQAGTSNEKWARYRVRVEEQWGGLEAEEVVFEAEVPDGGNCGIDFAPGVTYLVYAQRHEGVLVTSQCTRTGPLSGRQADVELLRARRDGAVESRLVGRVLRLRTDIRPVGFRDRPVGGLAGVRVEVRGQAGAREARTDAEGAFEVRGLPPGRYEVVPDLTGPYQLRFPMRPVDLDGCLAEVTVFTAVRSLQGTVVLPDGRPVGKNVMVAVVPAAATPDAPYVPAFTDESGRWAVPGLPAGRYTLAVNAYSPPTAAAPSGATWYPRAVAESDAQVLEITDDAPQDVQIRLREQLPLRSIVVRVVDERGLPVPEALVQLIDPVDLPASVPDWQKSAERGSTDKSGRWTVSGLASRAYRVEATGWRRGQTPSRLTAVADVAAGAEAASVVLRLMPAAGR